MDLLRRVFWRCETVTALILGWVLVFAVPFRRTAALIGETRSPVEPPPDMAARHKLHRAAGVCRRIARIAPNMPFRTTCLAQAVAGWLLLKRRGINTTIRFGVAMQDGKLAAHAWLMLGRETLLGGGVAGDFQPLADMGGKTDG